MTLLRCGRRQSQSPTTDGCARPSEPPPGPAGTPRFRGSTRAEETPFDAPPCPAPATPSRPNPTPSTHARDVGPPTPAPTVARWFATAPAAVLSPHGPAPQ